MTSAAKTGNQKQALIAALEALRHPKIDVLSLSIWIYSRGAVLEEHLSKDHSGD